MTTLRAPWPARQPRARPPCCIGQRRIHNLHKLPYRPSAAACAKHSEFFASRLRPTAPDSISHRATCYNGLEVILLFTWSASPPPRSTVCPYRCGMRARSIPLTRRERILPTGCTQVILNLARDFLLDCPEGLPDRRMPPALVVGARSVYEIVDTSDMADLIGIVFSPGGFAPFASDAAHHFSNQTVALDELARSGATRHATPARPPARNRHSPQARLRCLEQFLVARFHIAASTRRRRPPQIQFALRYFAHNPSIASVAETARQIGWSERRFSQVFREEVGLAPKVWCRIQRFQRAVRQLHAGADIPLGRTGPRLRLLRPVPLRQ